MNDFAAAVSREENSECTVGQFFPPWADYCESQDQCPYEGFRTLMDWGVTVKAGSAGTLGALLKFDPADVRVAFVRAKQAEAHSGSDGLGSTLVDVEDYEEEGMPLADFWLYRENVLEVLKQQGIRDFVWPVGELPDFRPLTKNLEDEDTAGFVYLGTAINRVLGLDDDANAETLPEYQIIRREIVAERGNNAWPVRMLARQDRVQMRGMDKVFEFVHFGDFAEWAFHRGLLKTENLAEKYGGELPEQLVKSFRLKAIERQRNEYRTARFTTGEGLIERDRRLAELNAEEAAMTAWMSESIEAEADVQYRPEAGGEKNGDIKQAPPSGEIWNLPTPLTVQEIARAFAGILWTGYQWKKNLSDCPKWLEPARILKGRRGGRASTWNPAKLAELLLAKKEVDLKKLSRLFRMKPELAPWTDEWGRYECSVQNFYD